MGPDAEDREFVLLGAGASVDAGVPASTDLTDKLVSSVAGAGSELVAYALSFVVSALAQHNARMRVESELSGRSRHFDASAGEHAAQVRSNLGAGVDVEMLMRAIDRLAERNTSELRPFVGSWDSTVQLLDSAPRMREMARAASQELQGALAQQHEAAVRRASDTSDGGLRRAFAEILEGGGRTGPHEITQWALERAAAGVRDYVSSFMKTLTSELQRSGSRGNAQFADALGAAITHGSQPDNGEVFKSVRRELEMALVRATWLPDGSDVDYLKPLALRARSRGSLTIASLNYDNCLELACRQTGVTISTGIDGIRAQGSLDFDQEHPDVRLLKLHGSANWSRNMGHVGDHTAPMQPYVSTVQAAEMQQPRHRPAIIFGQESKLTADSPFFDIFLSTRDALGKAALLTIIGYSFRDEHVNALIRKWFAESGTTRRIRIVDPSWGTRGGRFKEELREAGGKRLIVISGDLGRAKVAIPTLYG